MRIKGFTLIELLAVIVILAIIALIAIPMISKIIDRTEDSAVLRSAELYIDGVNQAIMRANLNNKFRPKECIIQENGNLICDGETELKIEATGNKPTIGILKIEDRRVKTFTGMIIDIYELEMNEDGKIIVMGTSEEPKESDDYVDATGAVVNLPEGLTPVLYSNGSWIVANTKEQWYDYENQEWANSVILNSGVEKNVGDTIDVSSEIKGMLVYIPRYEYKIEGQYGTHSDGTAGTQAQPGEIEVNFITKETTTASEGYRIHPAFTFGTTELNGIWVGKFETTGSADIPTVLPSIKTLVSKTVSAEFTIAQVFNTYVNNSSIDFHMAKNSEWGAVAYLSQSKYGKYGNSNYTGVNKQVMVNNCSNGITGVGANSQDEAGSTTTCITNTYATAKGQAASTTGNITGIYDMSGGNVENVMGVYSATETYSGINFSTLDAKYYDNYTTYTLTTACNGGVCYGHALSETIGWYNDYASFISSSSPWLQRGDWSNDLHLTGVFASYGSHNNNLSSSFRVILTES